MMWCCWCPAQSG
ncbi:hypothetical protein E2C01_064488 [Portunus trituberculatus]|uniref:Uncharacterized protein n=1 Tax=Portunus trituberculatus TaxID=210409 RepID=A0A5B7HJX4_PORTR|nr:hypothetical protein [Portunus trituberculatus]